MSTFLIAPCWIGGGRMLEAAASGRLCRRNAEEGSCACHGVMAGGLLGAKFVLPFLVGVRPYPNPCCCLSFMSRTFFLNGGGGSLSFKSIVFRVGVKMSSKREKIFAHILLKPIGQNRVTPPVMAVLTQDPHP